MRRHIVIILAVLAPTLGGCYGLYGNDEGERYAQRKDGVTLSSGDAKEVNARTHMNLPWPYGVGDRRIFVEGSRAVRAVERYRQGQLAQGTSAVPATTSATTSTMASPTPSPGATGGASKQ
jgi:hypothetical protein